MDGQTDCVYFKSRKAASHRQSSSQAVKAAGLVFVSGTAPNDPETCKIKGTTIQEQTRQCMANGAAIFEEPGSSLDKVVSATVVLAEEDDFQGRSGQRVSNEPTCSPRRQASC